MTHHQRIENDRLTLQANLDGKRTAEDRNRMGQFATPTALAHAVLRHGTRLLPPDAPIRFLDSGIGTGSFYSALRAVLPEERIERAVGFEVDPHYGEPARDFWKDSRLDIRIEDFTKAEPEEQTKANRIWSADLCS